MSDFQRQPSAPIVFFRGILANPAVFFLVGIPPFIAVSSTFERAWMYAVSMLFVFSMTTVFSALAKRWLPKEAQSAYLTMVAVFLSMISYSALFLLNPGEVRHIFLWLSLLGFEPLLSSRIKKIEHAKPGAYTGKIMASMLSFSILLLVFAAIREFLALGRITLRSGLHPIFFHPSVPENFKIGFFALIPGAFILAGYAFALLRRILAGRERRAD